MKTPLLCFVLSVFSLFLSAQEFDGVWLSEGYGQVLDINGADADLYQYTVISNILEESVTINGSQLGVGEDLYGELAMVGSQLKLTLSGNTTVYFNPLSELPAITSPTDDPLTNFNIFWQTYEDYCALFSFLAVDWQEQYDLYAPAINANTTDQELFDAMASMLATLNDGHSYLDDMEDNYFEGGPMISDLWYEYDYDMMDLIEEIYMDGQSYLYSGDGEINYGIIGDSIGYIAVNSFDDFVENGNELEDNLAFSQAIDQAFLFVQDMDALILDVRFNLGGYDSNSRLLADRLTQNEMPVYTKQARIGGYNDFADSLVFSIHPEGNQFVNKPVIVLTSDGTLSAADVFAMIAKEIPCVTLIGEYTYGAFSDNYSRNLPNGWEISISPERYKDIVGHNLEQQGVEPDILVLGDMDAFMGDQDNILAFAIENATTSCNPSAIHEWSLDAGISLFPNPSDGFLTVSIENEKLHIVDWEIVNSTGQVIVRSQKSNWNSDFLIDVSHLKNNNYYLNLHFTAGSNSMPFSVSKK